MKTDAKRQCAIYEFSKDKPLINRLYSLLIKGFF